MQHFYSFTLLILESVAYEMDPCGIRRKIIVIKEIRKGFHFRMKKLIIISIKVCSFLITVYPNGS